MIPVVHAFFQAFHRFHTTTVNTTVYILLMLIKSRSSLITMHGKVTSNFMKLTFEKQNFLDALIPAMTTVSAKNTIPSLEGVLITCKEDGQVTISSYDMKKGVVSKTAANQVERAGSYIIPAQRLMQILRLMPEGPITIDVAANEMTTISSLTGHFSLKAQKGEDFPTLPEMTGNKNFRIKAGMLKRMIGKVLHSIADKDIKPMLCGAYFVVNEQGVEVVSCNNFMLSRCFVKCQVSQLTSDEEKIAFIAPGHALQELIKLLSDEDKEVAVELTGKHAVFQMENTVFFTRLIEENYMDYRRIIPSGYPIEVNVNRELLLDSLDRVNLIADEKSQTGSGHSFVKINVEGSLFKLSSSSATGNAYDEIACDHTGDDLQIGFNGRFLVSCIKVLEGEQVHMTMKSPIQSITIEPCNNKENEELFYMVLPLRMSQ